MKNFIKSSKTWMFALLCVLFFSIGIKAEAAPGTVANVKQTGHNSSAVQVEWTPTTVGSPTQYQLKVYENKACTGDPYITSDETTGSEGIVRNLSAGKSYYLQVVALDKDKTEGTPSTAIEVVTSPNAKVTTLKQGKLATRKISFSWSKVSGANCYDVGYKKYGSTAEAKFKETTKTSYSISASADTCYTVAVYPMRKSSTGYIAGDDNLAKSAFMYTIPRKVTKLKLYSTGGTSRLSNIATFSAKLSNAADGYQYELRDYNNKKITTKTVGLNATNTANNLIQFKQGLKSGQFMRIRIRPYVNWNGKKKYVTKWSDYVWFAPTPKTVKAAISPSQRVEDGLIISWSKIKGANNYSVYVSRSRNSGYKRVTTTTSTKYNLRTFNGSQLTTGTYYYYIIANKKSGGKTYKSDDSWYFSKSIRVDTYYY